MSISLLNKCANNRYGIFIGLLLGRLGRKRGKQYFAFCCFYSWEHTNIHTHTLRESGSLLLVLDVLRCQVMNYQPESPKDQKAYDEHIHYAVCYEEF